MKAAIAGEGRVSVVRGFVLTLFLVSGAAGLIYEVTWTRAFGVVFGNTVFAVSTVLTAFMLGLAVGSWLFGKIGDRSLRPLRLYALLELAVGAYAFAFPAILNVTDIFYGWFYRSFTPGFYPRSLVRFIISITILFIPTALMGGTLPVLSSAFGGLADLRGGKGSGAGVGRSVGLLYAINTFGAVAGSFLSGYLLMRILGVSNTIYLAACANIAVGVIALVLSRVVQGGPAGRTSDGRKWFDVAHHPELVEGGAKAQTLDAQSEMRDAYHGLRRERIVVLLAVGVAGFCALALEVLWTRVLVFVLGTSTYAFACMLTCFILGLGLGSFLCSRVLGRIRNPIFLLGLVEFLTAISVLVSIALLSKLWHIDYVLILKMVGERVSFWREAAAHFIDGAIVLLVPAVLMGTIFPIAVKICARSWKAVGRRVGQVYACNTVGCVAGSFAAGFVMVPLFGLRNSFLIIAAIQLLLAVVVILLSERGRGVFAKVAVLISVVIIVGSFLKIPPDVFLRTINTYHYPSRIVYMKDDATGAVTVHDLPDGDRLIAVDGVDVAGMDLMLRTTQKLQGYAPLIVHGNAKKVLQIGFGSGETSGVGLGWGVDEYNIVEICPAVFEAGKFFEQINHGSYKDARLRKIIMDGKNFVKLTGERFDVIMNDSTYPGTTGSSALYTYDHFKECREHLNKGGVLSCWVPLDLRPEDFQIIVRSFQAVMPYCSLWMGQNTLNKHAVLLGTLTPMRMDFQHTKELVDRPNIAADLAEVNIHSVYDLLDCFVVGEDGLRKIGGNGPLNTDDKPFLEFDAAIKRDIEGCWIAIMEWISDNYLPVNQYVTNPGRSDEESRQVKNTLEQYSVCTMHTLRGFLGLLQGDGEITHYEFDEAVKANPQDKDVNSCLNELKDETKALEEAVMQAPASADLRSRLAKRYLLLLDYRNAAEQYNSFLQLQPGNAAAWNNLGICYQGLEQFDKAAWALERAIACDGRMAGAYHNLAGAYMRLGRFAAAVVTLERTISMCAGPQKIYVYDRLASAYLMQKDYNRAMGAIDKALELAGGEPALVKHLQERKAAIKRAAEGKQEQN